MFFLPAGDLNHFSLFSASALDIKDSELIRTQGLKGLVDLTLQL